MNHWRYVLLAFLASVSLLSVQGQGSLFVNASYEETSLSDILTKWELEYHLLFSYNETRLKNIKTTISFKSTPLNEALDRLLNPHGLTFEYVSPAHLLIKSDPAPNQLVPKHVAGQQDKPRPKPASQVRTIRGRVLLAHNNQPLPFATIRMLGSTRGATSTEEGIFYLRETLQAGDTLEVRYLGCHPRLIPVTDIPGSNYLKVFMDEKGAHEIEGVVITEGSEQTISVKGGAREITINPEKLGMISGLGEPDVLRGLQMLPGISSLNENAADLYVRGGTPDQNLILLDGMTIYQAGHFFGVIGGFNPRAIQSVSFQRGNFGAKYGGRTSSVLEMTGKPQLTDKAKFGVGLNLMNAHAFAEVPIIDGKSALMIAGRRSATDFFQSPYYQRIFDNVFQQGVIDFDRKRWQHTEGSNIDPTFYFYDTNLKWVFQPTKRDHISASFYKAGDKLNYLFGHQETGYTHQTEDQLDLINQGFSTVWARQWDRDFYSRWSVAQSSYHKDYTFQSLDSTDTFVSQYTHDRQQRIQDLSLKMDQEWRFHPKHAFNFGFHASDYKIRDIESQISIHHNTGPDTTLTRGQAWGSYGEYVLTPGAGLHITAGLRHTFFSLTQQNYWEPRFQLNWQVSDHFSAKAAWGRYAQFMNQVEHRNGFQVGQAFWGLSDSLQRPVSRSQDLSMGLAYENRDFLVDLEVYRRQQTDISTYTYGFDPLTKERFNDSLLTNGQGQALGIDLLVQKKIGAYTSWLAYSWGRVLHQFPSLRDNEPFFADHDARHQLKMVHMYQVKNWEFSMTFNYASGRPYTQALGFLLTELPSGNDQYQIIYGERNAERLSPYMRLDVTGSYQWTFDWGQLKGGLTVFNLTDRPNIGEKRYMVLSPNENRPAPQLMETNRYLLGFSPNIFLEMSF